MTPETTFVPMERILHLPRPGRLLQFAKARLYQPEIESEEARQILNHYNLALVRPPENLPFGWRNRNMVVHTSAGKKVLKRYRDDWQAETIIHEHSILRKLEETGFPAPRLVATAQGRTWINHGGQHMALFDYVAGENYAASFLPRRQRAQLIARAGQALAQLHQQLPGFLPQGRHHLGYISYTAGRRRDLAWHLDRLTQLPEETGELTDPEASAHARWLGKHGEEIAEKLCRLAELLEGAALPRLVIHGDYGTHNLHFHRSGMVTVHDFELARLEWRLVDLVIILTRLAPPQRRIFMAAYQSKYPVTPLEWHLWPHVWQYYRLRGAVQYWHTYFEQGDKQSSAFRLAGAQNRVREAEWALENKSKLWQLNYAPGEQAGDKAARVMMVVRLFYPWVGGTERQAHKLARELVENQVPVELVTGWWFRGTPQREVIDGIPVHRNLTLWEFFGIKGLRKFGGYLYIISLIWYLWRRRGDYDVIHVHGLNYHTFAAVVAGRLTGRKVVAKLANSGRASDIGKMQQDQQLALARFMFPTALKCDCFVALNETVVQELMAVGVPRRKIVALPNGVEVEEIEAKANYRLHNPGRIIFVGRLHKQKGLDTLLHACQQLCERYPDEIRLQLFGDGPLREELTALADRLGLTPHVEFRGETDQVVKHLQEADIFVLPSRAEGVSNALLEAMSCGLPVVASDVPGNVDVVENGKNGLLFDVGAPDSLAGQLLSLLRNAELRQRLGQAARRTVERKYSLGYVAGRYIALYQAMLTGAEINDAGRNGQKK